MLENNTRRLFVKVQDASDLGEILLVNWGLRNALGMRSLQAGFRCLADVSDNGDYLGTNSRKVHSLKPMTRVCPFSE